MVTHYPHLIGARKRSGVETDAHHAAESARTRVAQIVNTTAMRLLGWISETYCGLHGHDNLLQFAQDRLSLRCTSCGHESPGWELTETPPTVRFHGDPRRHAIARPQLVRERRIA